MNNYRMLNGNEYGLVFVNGSEVAATRQGVIADVTVKVFNELTQDLGGVLSAPTDVDNIARRIIAFNSSGAIK